MPQHSPAASRFSGDFPPFQQRHLISIADLKQHEIVDLLNRSERMIEISRQERKSLPTLAGKTQINLFFEPSTRTQSSFEIAGKRLGALVVSQTCCIPDAGNGFGDDDMPSDENRAADLNAACRALVEHCTPGRAR